MIGKREGISSVPNSGYGAVYSLGVSDSAKWTAFEIPPTRVAKFRTSLRMKPDSHSDSPNILREHPARGSNPPCRRQSQLSVVRSLQTTLLQRQARIQGLMSRLANQPSCTVALRQLDRLLKNVVKISFHTSELLLANFIKSTARQFIISN